MSAYFVFDDDPSELLFCYGLSDEKIFTEKKIKFMNIIVMDKPEMQFKKVPVEHPVPSDLMEIYGDTGNYFRVAEDEYKQKLMDNKPRFIATEKLRELSTDTIVINEEQFQDYFISVP